MPCNKNRDNNFAYLLLIILRPTQDIDWKVDKIKQFCKKFAFLHSDADSHQ